MEIARLVRRVRRVSRTNWIFRVLLVSLIAALKAIYPTEHRTVDLHVQLGAIFITAGVAMLIDTAIRFEYRRPNLMAFLLVMVALFSLYNGITGLTG